MLGKKEKNREEKEKYPPSNRKRKTRGKCRKGKG